MKKVGSQKGEIQIEAWTSEQKTKMIQVQGIVKAVEEDMIHLSTPSPPKNMHQRKSLRIKPGCRWDKSLIKGQ